MKIGKIIKDARKAKDITQGEAAKKLRITQSYLSQLELDKRFPEKKILDRIAKLYGIPVAIIWWKGTELKDIQPAKRQLFEDLLTPINNLIDLYFNMDSK